MPLCVLMGSQPGNGFPPIEPCAPADRRSWSVLEIQLKQYDPPAAWHFKAEGLWGTWLPLTQGHLSTLAMLV